MAWISSSGENHGLNSQPGDIWKEEIKDDGHKPSDLSELLSGMVVEIILALNDDHCKTTGHDPSKHYIGCTTCMYLRKLLGNAQYLNVR